MNPTLADLIKNEADRCVKCGLCLPHCPTYVKTEHEGESPRGRIALLQGIAENQLELTPTAETYINHCVSCRACEVVCPAKVEYGKLYHHGKILISEKKSFVFSNFLKLFSLKNIILNILPKLYLFRLASANGHPQGAPLHALLPICIQDIFERSIFQDALILLDHLKINYAILNQFRCCGGLHLNSGDIKTAEKLKNQNKILFEKYNTILTTATGCTAALSEQFNRINIEDKDKDRNKIQDITAFLLSQLDQLDNIEFKPWDKSKRILLHTPCTLKNILRQENMPEQLLSKIPNMNLIKLKHPHCCGASGTYFLEYPDMAEKLAEDILKEVKNTSADIFVTTNIGCAIHLKKLFKKEKIAIKIQHPVNVLAEHL